MPFHLPIKDNTATIRLLQISDPHLLNDKNALFAGVQPYHTLQAVLDDAKQHPFDFMLCTGDIAQESGIASYDNYLELADSTQLRHFYIRGNHDDCPDFPTQHSEQKPTLLVIGQWCIVLLNSQKNAQIHGEISTEQLTYLDKYLAEYPQHYFLIALHHNTFPVGCAWLDQHRLHNAEQFLATLAPYSHVKLVISGHVHQHFHRREQGIDFLSCPSTCVQFKPLQEKFCLDSTPPGYRTLTLLADGRYITEVHHLTKQLGEIDLKLAAY